LVIEAPPQLKKSGSLELKGLTKSQVKEKHKQIQQKKPKQSKEEEQNNYNGKIKRNVNKNENVAEYQASDSSTRKVSSNKPDVSGAHGDGI
jgi:hypothetical protein